MKDRFTRGEFLLGAVGILLFGCESKSTIETPKITHERKRGDLVVLKTEIFWQDDPKDGQIHFTISENALQPSVADQINISPIKLRAFFQQFTEGVSCHVRFGKITESHYDLHWYQQLPLDVSKSSQLSLTLANWQVIQTTI